MSGWTMLVDKFKEKIFIENASEIEVVNYLENLPDNAISDNLLNQLVNKKNKHIDFLILRYGQKRICEMIKERYEIDIENQHTDDWHWFIYNLSYNLNGSPISLNCILDYIISKNDASLIRNLIQNNFLNIELLNLILPPRFSNDKIYKDLIFSILNDKPDDIIDTENQITKKDRYYKQYHILYNFFWSSVLNFKYFNNENIVQLDSILDNFQINTSLRKYDDFNIVGFKEWINKIKLLERWISESELNFEKNTNNSLKNCISFFSYLFTVDYLFDFPKNDYSNLESIFNDTQKQEFKEINFIKYLSDHTNEFVRGGYYKGCNRLDTHEIEYHFKISGNVFLSNYIKNFNLYPKDMFLSMDKAKNHAHDLIEFMAKIICNKYEFNIDVKEISLIKFSLIEFCNTIKEYNKRNSDYFFDFNELLDEYNFEYFDVKMIEK